MGLDTSTATSDLELTFLNGNADGDVFIPLRDGPVPWAKESFADNVRELSGVRDRVITLASLRSMKSWPRDDPADAAKDRADLAALPSAPGGDAR